MSSKENSEEKPRDFWSKIELTSKSISLVLIPLVIGYFGYTIDFFETSRTHEARMVELALSILKTDPKVTEQPGIRDWAIELLEKNSGIDLDEAAKGEVKKRPLQLADNDPELGSVPGWVYTAYLTRVPGADSSQALAQVQSKGGLRVREGPGANFPGIGWLPHQSCVQLQNATEQSASNWVQISPIDCP